MLMCAHNLGYGISAVPTNRPDLTREIDLVEANCSSVASAENMPTLPAARNHAGGFLRRSSDICVV